jgi:hypothetical protein
MRIMVFLQGTTVMHKGAIGVSREERIRQVVLGADISLRDFESYVPIEGAVEKLENWKNQGAEILYLSSQRRPDDVEKDRHVLVGYGFPTGRILYRCRECESYASIAEEVSPDLIVEDDCASIGGEPEMTYPNMTENAKRRVKSIVVKEFGGIDHLPDDLRALKAWRGNHS